MAHRSRHSTEIKKLHLQRVNYYLFTQSIWRYCFWYNVNVVYICPETVPVVVSLVVRDLCNADLLNPDSATYRAFVTQVESAVGLSFISVSLPAFSVLLPS